MAVTLTAETIIDQKVRRLRITITGDPKDVVAVYLGVHGQPPRGEPTTIVSWHDNPTNETQPAPPRHEP